MEGRSRCGWDCATIEMEIEEKIIVFRLTLYSLYNFSAATPIVQRWIKGPMWLHFLISAPPVIVFSSACAGLAGGAIPALAQLASSSYHAAVSSSPSPPSSSSENILAHD
ncbi:uncharacterized protein LOC111371845 [Olea europaea var. sylvestris]|uniref:uncharacterized protein LOC111371845 n=1 Tax=Olea europaea var. sylvestris TaxID=158386 RepID=UPI000C1D469A|nr:uncharacterized protein LOC111371845 [Olea europaea var. sylvestris]